MSRHVRHCLLLIALCATAARAADAPLPVHTNADGMVQALERQTGANPFDPIALNNLATVKAAREDWGGAAQLLVRAHRIAPDNDIIRSNLDKLNDWLSRRVPAATPQPGPQLSQDAPDPPPLWAKGFSAAPAAKSTAAKSAAVKSSAATTTPKRSSRHRHHRTTPQAEPQQSLQLQPSQSFDQSPQLQTLPQPQAQPVQPRSLMPEAQ